ncbi:DUF938 domain-containing protein [Sphingomonas montanisoli]|uniref:DUF938 domain-containing protein n=1 Tax=Sphingomonas montanisoli TaxID=2606412 RepID=A0A5D9CGQ5_9SPHN|nr:DUF938 domain-containing protein [Sphingomonas montanisoli]TZG29291.1 DUF938 domain-containing protein [Sphingomonas montanisoli]
MSTDARRTSPSALRNRAPILEVLTAVMPPTGTVVEIASGTGEHVIHFAAGLAGLTWQPSDPSPEARASIADWIVAEGTPNILAPLDIDATAESWPIDRADAIVAVNMIHISPWAATLGLLSHAAELLPAGAPLVLYGPFVREGVETAPSNIAFDADLRARNPEWGLRDLAEVESAALAAGFRHMVFFAMPANNLTVVFRRSA